MKKIILHICILLAMAVVLVSCALVPLDVNKLLELKPDQKIYTSYNIWYDNKDEISQINYHNGKILPFGTEVKILEATKRGIVFQDVKTNEKYSVVFFRRFLVGKAEQYIKILFTTKNSEELAAGIKPEILEKIKTGTVEKGMTKQEVMLAYGYPSLHRTPSIDEDTWIYFDNATKKKRVIFNRKSLVIEIMRD
jgi:hypothetical protein